MRYFTFLLFGYFLCTFTKRAFAADNYPAVHVDYIKTVQFHPEINVHGEPILYLGQQGQLLLSFDDLTAESVDYFYVIEQVNADWSPGGLQEFEWLSGFNNNRIEDFQYSISSRSHYIHYWLRIPNQQVQIKKSGNYVLKIYEAGNVLVITRRFVVAENLTRVTPVMNLPASPALSRTHQEIDFVVDLREMLVRNPRQEITATIVQNGYWPGARVGIPPFFIRDNILDFDYQNEIVFPGGKEWRFFDTRTLLVHTERIADIRQSKYKTEVDLMPDVIRAYGAYLFDFDANGKFLIQTRENINNPAIAADYTSVQFVLQKNTPFDQDVYVIGAFNDYRCMPEYRMEYLEASREYIMTTPLKQGYYNYNYALCTEGKTVFDWTETEGNKFDTENEYQILIYYRPLGQRYDRLIACHTFKSNERR